MFGGTPQFDPKAAYHPDETDEKPEIPSGSGIDIATETSHGNLVNTRGGLFILDASKIILRRTNVLHMMLKEQRNKPKLNTHNTTSGMDS
ncbi:hypothetical protein FRC17_008179 [Serendipita sp. 399]|nr:hypothetical protein FRC17_008179 [Serendipita sp. 399]